MSLPNFPNAISFSDIQNIFGGSPPITLSEYYNVASGIPTSGEISVSSFHGKSAVPEYFLNAGTSTDPDNRQTGNYVGFIANVNLTIIGVSIFPASTEANNSELRVYASPKNQSIANLTMSSGTDWDLVAKQNLNVNAYTLTQKIPLSTVIQLNAGESIVLTITLSTNVRYLTSSLSVGNVSIQDSNIIILVGYGVQGMGPTHTGIYSPREFWGGVYYTIS